MANKNQKSAKKEGTDGIRCQITLRDPQTVSFLNFFPHRKGEVIQAALECYIKSENRHTRELQTLLGYKQADIDRLKYTLGESSPSNAVQSTVKAEHNEYVHDDQDFNDSEVDIEEDEEVMGDLDL